MKAKSSAMVIGLVLCFGNNATADKISLRVVEEGGDAIPGAEVLVSFTRAKKGTSKVREGKTHGDDRFRAEGKIVMGAFVKVTKDGYHEFIRRTGFRAQDHDVTVVLRKIEKPIPVVVKEMRLEFPLGGK